ncbi:MAG: CpsB/CapC family capsule biosynthesis tyrosine phosphatase [Gemmatimonadota bacterium]
MIDLHCHLLPGVDDGSRSVEQSVRVLQTMAAQGVTTVCLTPHLTVSEALNGIPPAHDAAFEQLAAAAPPEVRLTRGVELMLDRPFTAEVAAIPGIRLAGTNYVLVEFSRLVTTQAVEHALYGVKALGVTPVLAHPERYSSFSPAAVARWRMLGAVMQVDATTLLAESARGDRARQLLANGQADIAAADNHGDTRSLAAAREFLVAHGGAEQAALLLETNPAAILEGAQLQLVEPLTIKASLLQRLRRFRRRLTSEEA